jgi:aspartate kinase
LKFNRIAVVCSARSKNTKVEGTTNRYLWPELLLYLVNFVLIARNSLLRAAKEAETAHSKGYLPIVQAIEDEHVQAARQAISKKDILDAYITDVLYECKSLVKILESAQHIGEVSFRAQNKVISIGEKLACKYMAALLNHRGVEAQYVDLSDIIKNYNIATDNDGFYQQLAFAFGTEILACGNKVPVITGYFGHVPGGLLHSIGRGYTDLCAALVAVGVHAKELQIWKEVDGIFTADPRKVPTACLIPSVTPSEAAELTFYGSEVIHPFTMEQVIRARIPIRIKNVMNPRGAGTVIFPDEEEAEHAAKHATNPLKPKLFRTRSSSDLDRAAGKQRRPTAVTIKHSIVVLNVHSTKRTRAHGFLAAIFSVLDKWHLSVDLIASSEVHVSMALHTERNMVSSVDNGGDAFEDVDIHDERLKGAVTDLAQLGNVDLAHEMAIVSLVGKDLKNYPGISGRFFSVLGENNINIEMISQGKCIPSL